MAKLYRSSARRGLGGTVRVTVEVPMSVVAVLVADARANRVISQIDSAESILPQLLSYCLCEAGAMAADWVLDEGDGVRAFGNNTDDDYRGEPFSERVYHLIPNVRGSSVPFLRSVRPWWLKPGRGPQTHRVRPFRVICDDPRIVAKK